MKQTRAEAVKTTVIVGFSMILVVAIALICVGNYFYDIALNPKVDKSVIFSGGNTENTQLKSAKVKTINWIIEKSQDVYITSNDNLQLHGYAIKNNQSRNWAIVIHGYGGEGLKMSGEAQKFYNLGYNVLMPDLRGCGQSQGDAIGMGWLDRLDMIDWINHIISTEPQAQIVLYGVSMGGATVMMTTGEVLPANVKCAIEDCGYSSVNDEFKIQLERVFGLPEFPVITCANLVCSVRAGYNFQEASSVEQVKKSTTPTLFIHGKEDTFVPFEMLEEVYSVATCPKEKLEVENAGHVESSGKAPNLYWNKVENFLRKYVE